VKGRRGRVQIEGSPGVSDAVPWRKFFFIVPLNGSPVTSSSVRGFIWCMETLAIEPVSCPPGHRGISHFLLSFFFCFAFFWAFKGARENL